MPNSHQGHNVQYFCLASRWPKDHPTMIPSMTSRHLINIRDRMQCINDRYFSNKNIHSFQIGNHACKLNKCDVHSSKLKQLWWCICWSHFELSKIKQMWCASLAASKQNIIWQSFWNNTTNKNNARWTNYHLWPLSNMWKTTTSKRQHKTLVVMKTYRKMNNTESTQSTKTNQYQRLGPQYEK